MDALTLDSGANTTQHQSPISPHTPQQAPAEGPNPITYAAAERFAIPAQVHFGKAGSVFSIVSLLVMSGVSISMYQHLDRANMPVWVCLPFLFTIFGSTLGWVFELGLLLAGTPFQQRRNAFTRVVQQIRLLNLAPVTTTIAFFVCAMVIPDPGLRMALLYLAGAACFGLGAALFFGGASAIPLILLGTQLAQIIIVLGSPDIIGGGLVTAFLVTQALLQFSALLISATTPMKSTAFHLISTLSGFMLFAAIITTTRAEPEFAAAVAPSLPAGSLLLWGFIISCIAGLLIAMKSSSLTYNNFRAGLSKAIWSPMYFQLVSAKRFPNPLNLSSVYDKTPPSTTHLKPYSQAHSKHLPESLTIPAVKPTDIEQNVKSLRQLMSEAVGGFKLISALDHSIPQANVKIPLSTKPRLAPWSDGSEYWPNLFSRDLFGHKLPHGGALAQAPAAALVAFGEGQLLAYLSESGVASPFLRPAPERGNYALVSDFRHLERYATKADYESYGGKAYFRVNSDTRRLELESVIAPGGNREIAANPADPAFRHAEQMVLASMYFAVITGKHLAEIHMTYNLVEVCMHNAFDVQGQWNHPFRTFMYLHFFSHELAEEITTEHLIQEGAVFNQVFATTYDGMINHLNDAYSRFEYGTDENVEARAATMTMTNGELLPNSCIRWELEYFDIWQRYTDGLINLIYPDDEDVRNDAYLQTFHAGLLQVLVNGLPDRYEDFQTRKGVARFAADTIHHCVVRHQVYGTTGIKAALDPRISLTQVPRDSGTAGVDEWRSLAYVALATGEARFTLLSGKEGKDFNYLLKGVDERIAAPMATIFKQLQHELLALDKRWTGSGEEQAFNENYFRPVPSALHTGPGY